MALRFDRLDSWTEFRLRAARAFAGRKRRSYLQHVYVEVAAHAPLLPLPETAPPFDHYYCIATSGIDGSMALSPELTAHTEMLQGEANEVLTHQVLPRVQWQDFRRALCLLEPAGFSLDRSVLQTAGLMKSVEMFLGLPVSDSSGISPWQEPEKLSAEETAALDRFWGDASWRAIGYDPTPDLFGEQRREHDRKLAETFARRLKSDAGFKFVPEPLLLANSRDHTAYYVIFASNSASGNRIALHLLDEYRALQQAQQSGS